MSRLAGLVLMIGSVATIGWLVTSEDFAIDSSTIALSGLGYTDAAVVTAAIGEDIAEGRNLFEVPTQRIERALVALPLVAEAEVSALLPDQLTVAIVERTPVLVVRRRDGDYLVDADGVVLIRTDDGRPVTDDLPVVDDDRRTLGPAMEIGGRLDATDVSAMSELLAISPETLGSTAATLVVTADDDDGYVISSPSPGWRAVFGHYTPTLRPPDLIGQQVQCLRSLLLFEGEGDIDTVYLAPSNDRCGTYLPRSTPAPSPSASARM